MVGQGSIITNNVLMIDICRGSHTASLMLCQLVYWSDKTKVKGGWIAKTDKEWFDEARLSSKQARTARKILSEIGLVQTKVMKFSGKPTVHYLVDLDAVSDAIEAFCPNGQKENEEEAENTQNQGIGQNDPFVPKGQMESAKRANARKVPKGQMELPSGAKPYTETTTSSTDEGSTSQFSDWVKEQKALNLFQIKTYEKFMQQRCLSKYEEAYRKMDTRRLINAAIFSIPDYQQKALSVRFGIKHDDFLEEAERFGLHFINKEIERGNLPQTTWLKAIQWEHDDFVNLFTNGWLKYHNKQRA